MVSICFHQCTLALRLSFQQPPGLAFLGLPSHRNNSGSGTHPALGCTNPRALYSTIIGPKSSPAPPRRLARSRWTGVSTT
ncbi:hypothetical protein B0H10DRAFT_1978975 [Mycena sp. CBHHK59/15]|nr:hypothetical protein B0H10DRAFT_1978975 [Mycena sp. CBHHK59/15]